MSDAVGAINYAGEKRNRFLDIAMPNERGIYAEETARLIDGEVKRIMTEAHDSARRVLVAQRSQLETVTRRLLEREVMEGEELRQILAAEAPAPGPIPAPTATPSPTRA